MKQSAHTARHAALALLLACILAVSAIQMPVSADGAITPEPVAVGHSDRNYPWLERSTETYLYDFTRTDILTYSQDAKLATASLRTNMVFADGKLSCKPGKTFSFGSAVFLGDDYGLAGGDLSFRLALTGGRLAISSRLQKKAAAASEAPSKEPAAKPVAKTEAEQEDPAAAETERRRQHEEAEAKRKAEWERQQEEKRAAETAAIAKIEQMSETELVKASMERMKKETERLTRRNLKECVSEYVQTLCLSDPAFARMVMHPRKSMAHCLQYINRKAREYLLAEMEDNGTEPQPNGIYGGDVPEDTCYDWAEEYFRDANAEEDEIKEEPFVPKPYPGAPVKSKRQPKKEKTKAETKTAKPEQVIQMPQPEKSPDEEQFSMFDLMGGMAG